ncbi:hypothetical protein BD31_I1684 [Candidatus Nitrosopumilus salaria BD31]|uniref:Swt1-like HEPN domain-containing protein n=1 Tax=Candidatus Nitrosopumilus salarius BD31 TaxID=859350 RepID=I3D370_9ARCH|nr:hypothetical protein [Candidatus Nitrosopumilus salaria]EIJ66163.1 hypothetical protein BD31_I1684 [Candidatus Nitrosopumilus salaria BD31]
MWKIQHSINDLIQIENSSEDINNLVEFSSDENSILQFNEKYIKEANDNIEAYKILYCLENDLREKIRDCLSGEPNWIDDAMFSNLKTEINKRKIDESKAKILMRDDDDLIYMTLGELKDVILKKWDKFEQSGVFRSKPYIDRILTDINKARIIIAHNSKLQDIDIEQLNLNLGYYNKQK